VKADLRSDPDIHLNTVLANATKPVKSIPKNQPFDIQIELDNSIEKGQSQSMEYTTQIYALDLHYNKKQFLGEKRKNLIKKGVSTTEIKCKGLTTGSYKILATVSLFPVGKIIKGKNYLEQSYINIY